MLGIVEGRVLGCLLEKERTVPDQYPLTLNALVTACNQMTSREPVMHLVEHEVEAVLAELKTQSLVRYVHPAHGRSVTRYRQVAAEVWGLDAGGAALVAVLLLRGPQTTAELATRTERMHAFGSPAQVETTLFELVSAGVVQALSRQPGQREHRWQQLLAQEAAEAEPAMRHASPSPAPSAPSSSSSAAPAVAMGPGTAERLELLELRVARLEALLADLLPE